MSIFTFCTSVFLTLLSGHQFSGRVVDKAKRKTKTKAKERKKDIGIKCPLFTTTFGKTQRGRW